MKLQLTKDKTVEIRLPGGGGRKRGLSDVTGVVLNSGDKRGCPAVRLSHRKEVWQVVAAGFVPPPAGDLPRSWEDMGRQVSWSLPTEFQAPHAALAVVSPEMFARQTSPDALMTDLGPGAVATRAGDPAKKKLGIRRGGKKAADPAPSAEMEVVPGVPASASGMRFVTMPLAEEPFVIQSGMPEYQVLWAARLLPEGRRPTAFSVQTLPAALLASLSEQPMFTAAGGTAFAIYVMREAVYLAGYRGGELILFRRCPGVAGWEMLREGVKLRLGLDDEMVDEILDDALIDPRSAMEPFVRPVMQQVEISLDYLSSRHNLRIDKVFVMGLPSGASYWGQMAEESLGLTLTAPSVFDGLVLPAKNQVLAELTSSRSQAFLAAVGAARAVMEDPA